MRLHKVRPDGAFPNPAALFAHTRLTLSFYLSKLLETGNPTAHRIHRALEFMVRPLRVSQIQTRVDATYGVQLRKSYQHIRASRLFAHCAYRPSRDSQD